jgi:arylsulfatase
MRAAYYACISFIDYHVGRILDGLGEAAANTLVVFTSDHGELLGDYGSFGKRSMLDAAARVPLIARWPGKLPENHVESTAATLLDLWPTFLNAVGIQEHPIDEEGIDLDEAAQGDQRQRTVYSQFQSEEMAVYMAASADWKYIYSAPDDREWFFDRRNDPQESHNLAGNPMYIGHVKRMRHKLLDRLRRDGYETPLDGEGWRVYAPPVFPQEADAGLLFQDPPGTEARIAALGDYARAATVEGDSAMRMLLGRIE